MATILDFKMVLTWMYEDVYTTYSNKYHEIDTYIHQQTLNMANLLNLNGGHLYFKMAVFTGYNQMKYTLSSQNVTKTTQIFIIRPDILPIINTRWRPFLFSKWRPSAASVDVSSFLICIHISKSSYTPNVMPLWKIEQVCFLSALLYFHFLLWMRFRRLCMLTLIW